MGNGKGFACYGTALDQFYAWWWEHLPKNGGGHVATDLGTGRQTTLLNTWWPYVFDINTFTSTLPAPDILFPPEDVLPPAPPDPVLGIALGASRIGLSWTEPADDVGVTRYAVYRDGVLIRKTVVPYLTDSRLAPRSHHTYVIRACDGSDNESAPSFPVEITTLASEVPGQVINGGFEIHPGASGWFTAAYRADQVRFGWEPPGTAGNPTRCVSVEGLQSTDAGWQQQVDGLVPGKSYWLTGRIRGERIVLDEGRGIGANLCLAGTWDHTGELLSGTFDWRRVTLPFVAPASGTVTVGARLGYWGNIASGKAWFDNIAVIGPQDIQLGASGWRDDEGFRFELMAAPGRGYKIERSADLNSWQELEHLTPVDPVTEISDPNSSGAGMFYYRAVLE